MKFTIQDTPNKWLPKILPSFALNTLSLEYSGINHSGLNIAPAVNTTGAFFMLVFLLGKRSCQQPVARDPGSITRLTDNYCYFLSSVYP